MAFIALSAVIGAIAKGAVPIIKNRAERSEFVIKALTQFGLDPTHPPADFNGVYAYAMVEYGVDKPKPVLDMFRHEDIRKAFRDAFETGDVSIAVDAAIHLLEWSKIGDDIMERAPEADPQVEFALFYGIFDQVVSRTRRPAQARQERTMNTVLVAVTKLLENFGKSEALGGIKAELDWVLPASPIDDLANEMYKWFESLGYKFEDHQHQSDDSFEWIINVPVRRGYDRILVRGVNGEAELSQYIAVRESVDEQKTDEGWLVANRRVSQAVRDQCGHDKIFCYTFDELIDEVADFSGYLNWLESEVKNRGIDQLYVDLACTKDEFDPFSNAPIGRGHYDRSNGWIDGYIDRWLDDPAKEHISILGEFGTGKTWFAFHYAWKAALKYIEAKEKGLKRPRLPLVIPLRDYAKAVTVESLFSEFFFRRHEINLPGYSIFEQLNRMGKLLLIFDGFDEMAAKVDRQQMINNFWELARVVVPGSKAIITCRSEHFPDAKEGHALLRAELQASTAKLTGEPPQFEVLELEKFDDEQIIQMLSNRVQDPATINVVMDNPELKDLAQRPVMTELILDALPEIEAGKPLDLARIYLYAVQQKMERDIRADRTFTSLADKLYFLCELSWEMLSSDQMSINYRQFPDRLRRIFSQAVQEEKDLDHWHYDMMGQTMLIRNADGDYSPAHRSLLEFFVAYKFAAELGVLAEDFMNPARNQSGMEENAEPMDQPWSSYFQRNLNQDGEIIPVVPIKHFSKESISLLKTSFGHEPLSPAVLQLMGPMIDTASHTSQGSLVDVILDTRGRTESDVAYTGGNAATLLIHDDDESLKGVDLSGTNLTAADFTRANLTNSNLDGADLRDVNFRDTTLVNATFKASKFANTRLGTLDEWIISMGGSGPEIWFSYPEKIFPGRNNPIPLTVHTGQIAVGAVVERSLIWSRHITTIHLAGWIQRGELLHLLTVEGDLVNLDVNTGDLVEIDFPSPALRWYGADLDQAVGITPRDAYFLRIYGGLNLPSTSYDPKTQFPRYPERFFPSGS